MTALDRRSLLSVLVFLAGCAHPEDERWRPGSVPVFGSPPAPPSNSHFSEWNDPSVTVTSFATPGSGGETALTLKDLSDHGQAAFVQAMTSTGAKPDEIRAAIFKAVVAKAADLEGAATVEGTYKRTLVATVSEGWSARPGDRLTRTWVDIRPLNFTFEGYTVLATDNQVVNIAQISDTTSATLQAQLGRSSSGTQATTVTAPSLSNVLTNVLGTSAGASAGLTQQRASSASIVQQYTKLHADIRSDELRIYRESERNLDTTGNTLIALTLKIDPDNWVKESAAHGIGNAYSFTHRVTKLGLIDPTGGMLEPDKIVMETAFQKSPPHCPLLAQVVLQYEIRRVRSHSDHYVEGAQTADYMTGEYIPMVNGEPVPVEVVSADAVRQPSWIVYGYRLNPTTQRTERTSVQVRDQYLRIQDIDFADYQQARNFAAWLGARQALLKGKSELKLGGKGLYLYGGDKVALPAGPFSAARVIDAVDQKAVCKQTLIDSPMTLKNVKGTAP